MPLTSSSSCACAPVRSPPPISCCASPRAPAGTCSSGSASMRTVSSSSVPRPTSASCPRAPSTGRRSSSDRWSRASLTASFWRWPATSDTRTPRASSTRSPRLPHDVRTGLQLVIVCQLPASVEATLADRCLARGLTPGRDVVFTGYVPDRVLRAMYQAAELFVCPSLYEGFGLPVLEAARCRCPSITSDRSSLPEVLSFPPATFAPDPEAMAAAIDRALTDESFRSELVAAGDRAVLRHSWDKVASRTVAALERLAPVLRRQPTRPPPLRVAIVGAGSSVPTEVIEAIAERAVLERFETRAAVARRPSIRCLPAVGLWTHVQPGRLRPGSLRGRQSPSRG